MSIELLAYQLMAVDKKNVCCQKLLQCALCFRAFSVPFGGCCDFANASGFSAILDVHSVNPAGDVIKNIHQI